MAEEIVTQEQRGQLQLPQLANQRTFHRSVPLILHREEQVINNVVDIIDCVLSLVNPDDFEDEDLEFPDGNPASSYKRQWNQGARYLPVFVARDSLLEPLLKHSTL